MLSHTSWDLDQAAPIVYSAALCGERMSAFAVAKQLLQTCT